MSMFRSAADISSSESESSSDETENGVTTAPSREDKDRPQGHESDRRTPPLMTGVGHESDMSSFENEVPSPSSLPDVDAGGHANLMTAALLEFYCLSRAADLLNAQKGSHRKFTRDCPEVKYLGKKMYAYKSQFLSTHGVLAEGIHKEELGTTRQYYRDNLDKLGAHALEDLNLNDGQRSPQIGTSTELTVASKGPKNMQLLTEKEHRETVRVRGEGLDLQRLIGRRNTSMMENIQLDIGSLPHETLPLSKSSPVSFPLFSAHPQQSLNRLSRYEMEFSEIKILGRGSFGEVYHVCNHIDGQSYAVKKIPLSQRRLEQLQFGGQNQLENIMKEIRTLARLEHTNVVRYYGAWVEQVEHIPTNESSVEVHYENTQNDTLSHGQTGDQSFGVVFEHSESSIAGTHSSSMSMEYETHTTGTTQRRYSQATTASRQSRPSFGHSLEDDEEVESIPRDFIIESQGLSTFGGTDDDIFTDGLSQDPSKMQVQRRHRNGAQVPAVVLHIQMSLHPMSLSSYLNPQQAGRSEESQSSPPRRHCYHLMPSLRLMLEIITGVEYLHSKGIVHRDLKPGNIFLSSPDNTDSSGCASCQSKHDPVSHYCHPRIGDFGLVADISHLKDSSSTNSPITPREQPSTTHVVGTEFYRPPQSFIGEPNSPDSDQACFLIDEKLDIFALGVILFELLYRLGTKMERQFVLSDLTRGNGEHSYRDSSKGRTIFPADFENKIDMGSAVLDDGVSVAESIMACIRSMMEPPSGKRLHCSEIKKRLEEILSASEKALSP